MRRNLGSLAGGLVVAGVVLAAYYWLLPWLRGLDAKVELKWPCGNESTETVARGWWGGDKEGLLEDPEVVRILAEDYGMRVEGEDAASLAAARGPKPAEDFAWTSSATSAELFKERAGAVRRQDALAHSPLVIHAWPGTARALVDARLARERDGTLYLTGTGRLASMLATETSWSEIGLDHYGAVNVGFSDPKLSDDGLAFMALLANERNRGTVVGTSDLPAVLPPLKRLYERQGLMESEPDELLDAFLSKGAAVRPMIAAYECGLRERKAGGAPGADVVTIYPEPTIWSDHVFLAFTEEGERLSEALKDERIQRIAWERHGLRPGETQPESSDEATGTPGMPGLRAVTQTPRTGVMKALIEGL